MTQRDDLGMRGRIVGGDRAVVAGGDHLAGAHDDGAHGHLAHQPGVLRLIEGESHRVLVGGEEGGRLDGHGAARAAV